VGGTLTPDYDANRVRDATIEYNAIKAGAKKTGQIIRSSGWNRWSRRRGRDERHDPARDARGLRARVLRRSGRRAIRPGQIGSGHPHRARAQLGRAFHRHDVAFIDRILADEFIVTYDNGARADRKVELQLAATLNENIESSAMDEFIVKEFGNTAVVGSRCTWSGRSRANAFRRLSFTVSCVTRRPVAMRVESEHARPTVRLVVSGCGK